MEHVKLGVSAHRACRVLGQPRSSQCYRTGRAPRDGALLACIKEWRATSAAVRLSMHLGDASTGGLEGEPEARAASVVGEGLSSSTLAEEERTPGLERERLCAPEAAVPQPRLELRVHYGPAGRRASPEANARTGRVHAPESYDRGGPGITSADVIATLHYLISRAWRAGVHPVAGWGRAVD